MSISSRYPFDEDALKYFQDCIPAGKNLDKFKEEMVERKDLLAMIGSPENMAIICQEIFKWGGINRNNEKALSQQGSTKWLDVAVKVREGGFSRSAAYSEFNDLRTNQELKGIGPAYFTKLIYFLMPRNDENHPLGYIMDQWVGCSINVLTSSDVVLMNSTFSTRPSANRKRLENSDFQVSDINDSENYENYCKLIEALALEISEDPECTEQLLMSTGGRKPLAWRKYVKDNRKPFNERS